MHQTLCFLDFPRHVFGTHEKLGITETPKTHTKHIRTSLTSPPPHASNTVFLDFPRHLFGKFVRQISPQNYPRLVSAILLREIGGNGGNGRRRGDNILLQLNVLGTDILFAVDMLQNFKQRLLGLEA